MFEELNQHRAAVAENIQKAMEIGFTGGELEKAHKVGDVHPNGKWVWTQLPSGKFDWRVIKKTGAGSGAGSSSTAQKTSNNVKEYSNLPDDFTLPDGGETLKFKIGSNRYLNITGLRVGGWKMSVTEGNKTIEEKVTGFQSNVAKFVSKYEPKKKREDSMGKNANSSASDKKSSSAKKPTPSKQEKKAKVPSGYRIYYEDDLVEVYDDKGKKVYSGLYDYCDYKDEVHQWNRADQNYDLPHGYKLVGKTKH